MITLENKEIKKLESVQSALLRTLLYFEVFRYPLNLEEIWGNCQQQHTTLAETESALDNLVEHGFIKKEEGFYFVNENNSVVEKRRTENELAAIALTKAFRYSRLISRFPFVRGVYLSGSLSKGVMTKDGDIDYFIITTPSRLWLCRTLLVVFKKTILLNSRKYFCVNYFVDTDNIEIPDRNLFTATELAFIQPTYNYQLYLQCMEANSWIKNYYPNKDIKENVDVLPDKELLLKQKIENLLNGKFGEKLDQWCFRLTLNFWRKKFKDFDHDQFDIRLRSRKNVSKHHPQGFQARVLDAHLQKIKDFESKHNLILE